jgi:mono/diheme cytochrome c family protein
VTFGNSVRLLIKSSPRTRLEHLARIITIGILAGFALALLAGVLVRFRSTGHGIELIARQPASGGWSRDRIVVNQGERVRLRIRSEDVVHGFAIGRMGVDAGPIEPGKVTTVEFVADQPGEFTFYCTMWCDPNHARMRGILEVRGPAGASAPTAPPATDVTLQHLDDPRNAGVVPVSVPSATRGLPLYKEQCASCHGEHGAGTSRAAAIGRREFLLDLSPIDVFRMLAGGERTRESSQVGTHSGGASTISKAVPSHAQYARDWNDQERWDAVATVWSFGTKVERLDLGQRLYAKNCAACHGERGAGNGPGGKSQPKTPADFTDARRMLAGTTALYTAKIRRGGMGTGMPYWGSIFTEEELTALVDHLWTFSVAIAR